ncbi:MAG: cupin domain-containing protein [Chloroflexi bacterium]|nr:cupin domain-containing protein [Chloroflexota bacterium]
MRIIKVDEIAEQTVDSPLFTGGAVTRQPVLGEQENAFFSMSVVNFSPGARNWFHKHTSDQVLLVTAGRGIVASETEERDVGVGDIAYIPAGEKHWHGATPDSAFSHITFTAAGSETEQLEP